MSCEMSDEELVRFGWERVGDLLHNFFGVEWVEVEEGGNRLKCGFSHISQDGLSEEKRWCFISNQFAPEENMKILIMARRSKTGTK